MLWHIGEWAGTVLAAGVVAGLVVVTLGVVAGWLVYRRARHRVEALTSTAARYALQTAPSWPPCGRGGCHRRWCTTFVDVSAAHPDWSEPPRDLFAPPALGGRRPG
jgi:hypothetical protein